MNRMVAAFAVALGLTTFSFAGVETQPSPTEIDQLRSQVVMLKAQVVDLQRQLADAKSGKSSTTKPSAIRPATDIDRAIAAHKLVNGMTLKQANESLGVQAIDQSPSLFGYSMSARLPEGEFFKSWIVPAGSTGAIPGEYRAHFTHNTISMSDSKP